MDSFNTTKNALLFDLDGTLIDTAKGFELLLNDLGWAINNFDDLARYYSGLSVKTFLEHLLIDKEGLEDKVYQFSSQYSENIEKYTFFYPDVEDIIKNFASMDIIWGIISNKKHAQCVKICQKFDLNPNFLLGSGIIPFKKPHPAPLLKGAHKLGVKPEHCYYFGDMPTDLEASEKALMKAIYCRYGCHQYLDPEFSYKMQCHAFSEIFDLCQIEATDELEK